MQIALDKQCTQRVQNVNAKVLGACHQSKASGFNKKSVSEMVRFATTANTCYHLYHTIASFVFQASQVLISTYFFHILLKIFVKICIFFQQTKRFCIFLSKYHNKSKITFVRHAERIYILSFSNPCATFALGVHIFFCSK